MNKRTWTELPGGIKVLTKLGTLTLTVTGRDHIYADANSNVRGDINVGLTSRGVRYGVSAHLYRWRDGAFHLGQEVHKDNDYLRYRDALYISRTDYKEVSGPARTAIATEVERAVAAWATDAHSAIFELAQVSHVNNRIISLETKREGLMQEVAKLDEEIQSLLATLPEGVKV